MTHLVRDHATSAQSLPQMRSSYEPPRKLDQNEIPKMLASVTEVRRLITYTGKDAQDTVDAVDKTMTYVVDIMTRKRGMWVISKLCRRNRIFPTRSILRDPIALQNTYPLFGGGFADVYGGILSGVGAVAVKRPRIYSPHSRDKILTALCKEASVWQTLKHPNVLPFIGVSPSVFPGEVCLVTPWLQNGHLGGFLARHPEVSRVGLMRDIAAGLYFLHSLGIVHGDIKTANILINDQRAACLADFGLASIMAEVEATTSVSSSNGSSGTARWMAPELLRGAPASMASDVYAFGMVAWEIFTGHVPFWEIRYDAGIIYKVLNGERPLRPSAPGLSDNLWNLIERCWDRSVDSRPTVEAISPVVEQASTRPF